MHSSTVVRKIAVAAQPVRVPTDFLDDHYRIYANTTVDKKK